MSKRRKRLRFDVPVAGPGTIPVMHDEPFAKANAASIAIVGYHPEA